jgi:ABC-type bacteriocin/lantibiotic exporter with double-glycine peptidase domain
MDQENEKYKKIVNALRDSKPVMQTTGEIEREVIRRIQKRNPIMAAISDSVEFIFSWVYIGWVRRSLIALSIALVLIFVYQQGTIIKRIDILSRQIVIKNNSNNSISADEIEKLLTIYKSSGKLPSSFDLSDKKINELIESMDELRVKYKDLEDLIENDAELKKIIEEKLIENNRTKINL